MKFEMDAEIDKMVTIRKSLSELKETDQTVEERNNDLKYIFEDHGDSTDLIRWKKYIFDIIQQHGL
jgi:hypothetical protein